jgi:hypothetical protein
LCFRKDTQEIFSELDETKVSRPEIYRTFQRTEEELEWGHEGPHTRAAQVVSHIGGAAKDREGLEALPGTLPERGIATEGLLHRHAYLQSDE